MYTYKNISTAWILGIVTYPNLTLHGDGEEYDEIDDQDGPENGHIEGIKACADHTNQHRLPRTVPGGQRG